MKAKMTVSMLLFFFSLMPLMAQNFTGIAYYESKTKMDVNFGGRQMSEAQRKMIEERMKKAFEKTFILTFDKTSSLYKEEQKLDQPGGSQGGFQFRMMGGGGDDVYYKNIQDKSYKNQTETFGKFFLIEDELKNITWKLSGETKKIGNYTCYKATAVKKLDTMAFRFGNRSRPREAEKKEIDSTQNKASTTNLLDRTERKTEAIITAWYTMEIPISQGPAHYWGLPGLILEVSDDRTTMLCSKLVLNPKDISEIEVPSKGKKISQKDFDEIMKKKMKEMSERFRAGNRRGDSHRIMIRH